jgi:hypothetical protein
LRTENLTATIIAIYYLNGQELHELVFVSLLLYEYNGIWRVICVSMWEEITVQRSGTEGSPDRVAS